MTKFLLIRHGETEWNRELIFRGRSDIPLSAVGRRQAAQLAAALAAEPLAAIYASPLSRARDTAAAIAQSRKLAVIASPHLIDMNCGAWEGLSVAEVQARYPQEYEMWTNQPDKLVLPGGEGLSAVRTRLRQGLRTWHKLHENQTIALVTHRIVCKILLCEILRLPNSAFWQIQQDLCALNIFANSGLPLVNSAARVPPNPCPFILSPLPSSGCPRGLRTHAKFGKYVLLKMNDTCHLRGIGEKPGVDF